MAEWRVDRSWRGERAPPAERALVRAQVARGALIVEVEAPWHGDPPPPGAPGSRWGLWGYEVVELFLRRGAAYTEIELGPHGHFLVLQLLGPRRVRRIETEVRYQVERRGDRWRGVARLPAWIAGAPCSANAYAIHGVGPGRRYLVAHPVGGARPDFHRLGAFRGLDGPL